ncbi:MAG: hypothetical protein AABW73_02460 [Nanoarchaeota archaeon]
MTIRGEFDSNYRKKFSSLGDLRGLISIGDNYVPNMLTPLSAIISGTSIIQNDTEGITNGIMILFTSELIRNGFSLYERRFIRPGTEKTTEEMVRKFKEEERLAKNYGDIRNG